MIGVCAAGLASTELPAASAAATWPVKIASGKFHGEMQTNGPRPRSATCCARRSGPAADGRREQAARLAGVVAQEVDGLANVTEGVVERLAGFAHDDAP